MFQLLNAERWTGLTLFLVPSLTVRMMAALVWQGTAGLSSWGRIASDSSERMIRTEVLQSLGQFRATCHFEPGNHGLRAVCRAWLGDFWRRLSCCALETPRTCRTSSTGGLESRARNQTANRTRRQKSCFGGHPSFRVLFGDLPGRAFSEDLRWEEGTSDAAAGAWDGDGTEIESVQLWRPAQQTISFFSFFVVGYVSKAFPYLMFPGNDGFAFWETRWR